MSKEATASAKALQLPDHVPASAGEPKCKGSDPCHVRVGHATYTGPVTRYDGLIARLRDAAQPDRAAPPDFAAYLDKVRRHAYKVTDRDVEELKAAGHSEDEIFEQTASTAVAAGLERLDAGLKALR
jgi:alkylhydroperoxidase family enzyme